MGIKKKTKNKNLYAKYIKEQSTTRTNQHSTGIHILYTVRDKNLWNFFFFFINRFCYKIFWEKVRISHMVSKSSDAMCLKKEIVVWRSPLQKSAKQFSSNCYCLCKVCNKSNCCCLHKVVNSVHTEFCK